MLVGILRSLPRSLSFIALLAGLSGPAMATVYTGGFDLSNGNGIPSTSSVSLSFTTDGTIGTITAPHIITYDILITQGSSSAELTPMNSSPDFYGIGDGNLTATSSGLYFLFDNSPNGVLIFDQRLRGPFFCLQNIACTNNTGAQIQADMDIDSPYGGSPFISVSGNVLIASAVSGEGAVPEISTWAMMLAGMGLVGFAMRRHQNVSVSYA